MPPWRYGRNVPRPVGRLPGSSRGHVNRGEGGPSADGRAHDSGEPVEIHKNGLCEVGTCCDRCQQSSGLIVEVEDTGQSGPVGMLVVDRQSLWMHWQQMDTRAGHFVTDG